MESVTVITVCYNAEDLIEKTMLSVLDQDYNDLEYIIIDGASKDNTTTLARDLLHSRSDVKSIMLSEKDNGIYDAMNKGINLASGNWIIFMNAGDMFYSDDVVSKLFSGGIDDSVSGIFGNTLRFSGDWSKEIKAGKLEDIGESIPLPFCHQSVFVRTEVLREIKFDTQYKQAADYNFFMHCYLKKLKFAYVDVIVSRYAMGGISERNNVFHLEEKIRIRETIGVEKYSPIKKWWLVSILRFKQCVKKCMPEKMLKKIRGF